MQILPNLLRQVLCFYTKQEMTASWKDGTGIARPPIYLIGTTIILIAKVSPTKKLIQVIQRSDVVLKPIFSPRTLAIAAPIRSAKRSK